MTRRTDDLPEKWHKCYDEPKRWTTRAWYAVAVIAAACIAWGIVTAYGGRV